jgi:hypothetical protein
MKRVFDPEDDGEAFFNPVSLLFREGGEKTLPSSIRIRLIGPALEGG